LFEIACAEMAATYPTCSMALREVDCSKLEAEVKIEVGFLWSRLEWKYIVHPFLPQILI
jgi:hypothetical protein